MVQEILKFLRLGNFLQTSPVARSVTAIESRSNCREIQSLFTVVLSGHRSRFSASSVTRHAIRQLRLVLYFVIHHELPPQGKLVRRRLIGRVKDVLTLSDVKLRLAMAPQAPTHVKSIGAPGNRHFADGAV